MSHLANLKRIQAELEGEPSPVEPPEYAFRVFSRVLDAEVWIVETERHADELERELEHEGDRRLVFTTDEVQAMVGMISKDMAALMTIRSRFPGARIGDVVLRDRHEDA